MPKFEDGILIVSIVRRTLTAATSAAGLFVISAAPAHANSSAASADIAMPAQDTGSAFGKGDEQFRQLFAKWEALDDSNEPDSPVSAPAPIAPSSSISIPSRMPLEGSKLTSGYGMRTHPVLGGRRRHTGIDLAAPTGTPVYATADGVVSRANRFSSYGLFISIEHGGDLQTRFAHLSRIAVSAGEQVHKGDLIGYVGSTGRSTGPHLHYEVRVGGQAVNPIPYMAESDAQQAYARVAGR